MYCEHFGLKIPPFNNTPDPRFFFNSPDHEEALASLLYAVEERKGFVLVTGEVGAGKTLLSRLVLNRLHANVRTAVITNTRLNGPELLLAICREFEIDTGEANSSAELTHKLEEFLLEQYSRDRLAVVVIDEAQNLPIEALEELRMLGNLEADDAKLLQVLLLGQPELQEAFRHPSLRQTFQRVFRTFHLRALNETLTAGYIHHRLSVAGAARKEPIFQRKAVDAVYRHSEGIPRLINQICDNALLSGYSSGVESISETLVEEVVEQMMSLSAFRDRPKPHGAFARQALGEDLDRQQQPIDRSTAIPTTVGSLRSDAGMSSVEISGLTQRLRKLEESLTRIERRQADTALDHASHELTDIAEARETLNELRSQSHTSQTQIDQILRKAENTAKSIENRASDAVSQAEKHRSDIEARTSAILSEFANLSRDQKERVESVLKEGREEVEAVRELRKKAAEIHQNVLKTQQESERRVGEAIAEASNVAKRLENQTRDFLTSAKSQSGDLNGALEKLLDDMRQKSEASQKRMIELLAQQRSDFERAQIGLDDAMRKATARSNAVEKESESIISSLKNEATKIIETIHGVRDRTLARSEQACDNADALVADISKKMDEAHKRLVAMADEAESRIEKATTSLQDVQKRVIADSEDSRSKAETVNSETQLILLQTRSACDEILAQLRNEVAEQTKLAEAAWKESSERGNKTLGEVRSELETARNLAEATRTELESLVGRTQDELNSARATLEEDLNKHHSEVAKLSQDALAVKLDFEQRFKAARTNLDNMLGDHDSTVAKRIDEWRGHLSATEREAERIFDELKQAIDHADVQTDQCRSRLEMVASNLRNETEAMIDKQRKAVTASQEQLQKLTETADGTTGRFQNELRQLNESARSRMTSIGKELADVLAKAITRADEVRKTTESTSVELTARLEKTRAEASETVELAEETVRRIRLQSKSSLEEVRQCLTQMNERADSIRRELGTVGDEIRHVSKETTDQLVKTGDRISLHVESLRKNVQAESDANLKRLTSVRQQVEQSAEQMRQNAAKLLDQVQSGTNALRRHADDMLAQAQTGADKLNKSAATMMIQAQTSSERFREQAETLLHNAEKMAEEIRGEVTDLRSQVSKEADRVRSQISDARGEIVAARHETAELVENASQSRKEAEARAADLIERAAATEKQAEAILKMPKDLIDEARKQAMALSEMSRKVSSIVKNLNEAGSKAEQNRKALTDAEHDADEKLSVLKRHTERVGQLVGIIRQLYGSMDAKVERLRGRLTQVDDLFRTVPQELNGIRSLLDAEFGNRIPGDDRPMIQQERVAAVSRPAATVQQPTAATNTNRGRRNLPDLLSGDSNQTDTGGTTYRATPNPTGGATVTIAKPAPKASQTGIDPKVAKASREQVRNTLQAGSLGEVVKRNQKLNQWLKDVLGEEHFDDDAAA